MKVREALAAAAARLAHVSETPRLDAELLMAEALGTSRETLLLSRLDETAPPGFEALIARRLAHEPLAYITGRRAFWTIELEVGPGVLIPRPDSETLIEAAVERFGAAGPRTVLDLGTGSGALLLAALDQWPGATGHGRDASPAALAVAQLNAARLGLANRATFSLGDWGEGLDGPFDLVLCNPPYVAAGAQLPDDVAGWEPDAALYAGADGLEEHRRLAPEIARLLAPGGLGCVEIGFTQAESAGALFAAAGFRVSVRKDLAARDRCLVLRR
jgi:release factor glutamine methyltransferase